MAVYPYILHKMCFITVDLLDPHQAALGDWVTLRSTGLRDFPDGPGLAMGSESWLSCSSQGLLGAQAKNRGTERL